MGIIFLLFTSCTSFSGFYRSYIDSKNNPAYDTLTQGEEPKIYSSSSINYDMNSLISQGYVLIGETKVNGPERSIVSDIKTQCKANGATVVLYQIEYTHTVNNQNKARNYNGNTGYGGSATLLDAFGASADLVNSIPVNRYDYTVYYFVTMSYSSNSRGLNELRFILHSRENIGIEYCDLGNYLEGLLDRTTGVYVISVLNNSPAFEGGLQAGDIIVEINGKNIRNSKGMFNILRNISKDTEIIIKYLHY
jgi:hypothetical protein